MNLIRKGIIVGSLAAALLVPTTLFAQPAKLTITLSVAYQDPTPKNPPVSNPNVVPSDTKQAKISAANILTLVTPTAGPFPAGSWLSYDPDLSGGTGAIGALDKAGDFEDLSTNISIVTDTSGLGALTSSTTADTIDPVAQSTTYLSDWTITFDDGNGNSFNISGVIKTIASLAKQDANMDPQTETVSFSGSVSGWGTYLNQPATFTGTISGTGKGPQGS